MKKLFLALILDFILIITNIAHIIHQGFFRDMYPNITIDDNLTYNSIIPLYSSPFRIILHVFCKSSKEQAAFAGLVDGSISISILVFGWIYF